MKKKTIKPFAVGQRVLVLDTVEHYGGKQGVVQETGVQLGYPVVRVIIDGRSSGATFAPEELVRL